MNQYGQTARDRTRQHRPDSFSLIPEPDRFFEQVGEEIASEVSRLLDEIVGQPRPGENLEEYRHRSYQALRTAEEMTIAEHPLFLPTPDRSTTVEDWSDDPDLADRYRMLDEINRTIHTPL